MLSDFEEADLSPDDSTTAIKMKRHHTSPLSPTVVITKESYIGKNGTILWPDVKKVGKDKASGADVFMPRETCANARVAIMVLEVECGHDLFHDRLLIYGQAVKDFEGELSDHACQMLRVIIKHKFDIDPGFTNVHHAAVQLCLQRRFDPVGDYLDGLTWDKTERLNTWFQTYLGAENTELNRAIGSISLIAAVRRARYPGCKFDQIIVLEGPEGRYKSSAIELMAGKENFSDQTILGLNDRTQMENVKGKWLYEIADLTGISKSDVESVKAFASRTHDRARPAYGKCVVEQPRRCVFFATTNESTYLKSQTGNRRFWPVKVGTVDIDALYRDRDQLWAEAAHRELNHESIVLPEALWIDARIQQERRLDHNPWEDIIEEATPTFHRENDGELRISSSSLLFDYLKIPAEKQTDATEKRLAQTMRRLGWAGPKKIRFLS